MRPPMASGWALPGAWQIEKTKVYPRENGGLAVGRRGDLIRRPDLGSALGFARRFGDSLGLCRLRSRLLGPGRGLLGSFGLGVCVSYRIRLAGRFWFGILVGLGLFGFAFWLIGFRLLNGKSGFLRAPHCLLVGVRRD